MVLTFRQVAERFESYVLDVEIKLQRGAEGEEDPATGVVAAAVLAAETAELGREDSVIVASFDDEVLEAVRRLAPGVATSPGQDAMLEWFLADAQRTKAVRSWLTRSELSLLMSGTPMENRVDEFRTLVHHLRPDLAATIRETDEIAGADAFRTALGSFAVGPLTGSVSATGRQQLVDDFSSRGDPAVLVGQIEAGGVGLNIQAASVVVLTEPQWKPSTEDQAIARCHRLGQVRPVEVHRLLTENSVDERMLVILARKSALFAEYVRQSAMKDATPEAVEITNGERTSEVANQADQERRIIELERRRLGLEDK